MRYAAPIARLLEELERLPGVGPKSAQRIAYWLLTRETEEAQRLADAIVEVKRTIHFCSALLQLLRGRALRGLCGPRARPEHDLRGRGAA